MSQKVRIERRREKNENANMNVYLGPQFNYVKSQRRELQSLKSEKVVGPDDLACLGDSPVRHRKLLSFSCLCRLLSFHAFFFPQEIQKKCQLFGLLYWSQSLQGDCVCQEKCHFQCSAWNPWQRILKMTQSCFFFLKHHLNKENQLY